MGTARRRRNNGVTVVLLLSVVAGMIGLSSPRCRSTLVLRTTGFGGSTQRAR